MKKVTFNTYKKDKYYPRVVRAVAKILARTDEISPGEILLEMGNLNKKKLSWRMEITAGEKQQKKSTTN